MKIVMFGPPGAGKGTISAELAEKYKIPHISTGDLLRKEIAEKTELGQKIQGLLATGHFAPDEDVIEMVKKRLAQDDCKNGYILDGFPRTTEQAKVLEEIARPDYVFNLEVSSKLIIKRLSNRRNCKECKTVYNLITNPPKKDNICDKCDGELIQRDDDQPHVIQERLNVYRDQTSPLIGYYQNENLLHSINGEPSPKEVVKSIVDIIEK